MEKVTVICGGCGSKLRFKPRASRTSITCPKCAEVIDVSETPQSKDGARSQSPPLQPRLPQPEKLSSQRKLSTASESSSAFEHYDDVEVVERPGFRLSVFPALLVCVLCMATTVSGVLKFANQSIDNDSVAAERPVGSSRQSEKSSDAVQAPKPARPQPIIVSGGSENPARYEMNPGDVQTYRIEVTSGEGRFRQTTRATCVYTVQNGTLNEWKKYQSSGTGFVVSPDGHIATCAHVIDRAGTIEVELDGTTYEATIVAQDAANDLAIIRIATDNLTTVSMGNSDAVELAETARAFGYPLSTVLGTDLKVVTGSIAGIVNPPDGGRRIQTDAPINPGNSGGPLVNDFGDVIGIASSKLSSRMASSVGLAVPSNELKKLMKLAGLSPLAASGSGRISGPAIARKVTPCMAFIRIRGARGKVFDLDYQTTLIMPSLFPASPLRGRGYKRGSMKVDQYGTVVEQTGDGGTLPFGLGPITSFCLTPLDHLGRDEWTQERTMALQLQPSRGPQSLADLIRAGAGFSMFDQPRQPDAIKLVPAEETVRYTREDAEEKGQFLIERHYELVTLDDEEKPSFRIEGNGKTYFDSEAGSPAWGNYSCRITSNAAGQEVVVPISSSFRRYSQKDVERERNRANEIAQKKREADRIEQTVPNPELVDQLLKDLNGATGNKAKDILNRLAKAAIVEEKRDQIRDALTPFGDASDIIRTAVYRVIVRYSTPDDISQLREIASLRKKGLRDAVMAARIQLAKFGHTDELVPMVMQLDDPFQRIRTSRQLKTLGEVAEGVVLEMFSQLKDDRAQREALEILGEIGTDKSLPLLEEMTNSKDTFKRLSAERGLRELQSRLKL